IPPCYGKARWYIYSRIRCYQRAGIYSRELYHRTNPIRRAVMAQKSYITMTGISKWPVLNSLWAAICCNGYVPDRIFLFVTRGKEAEARALAEWITTLTSAHGQGVIPELT